MTPTKNATSVLAGLTAEVMADKVAPTKRQLTPVEGEARPPTMPVTKASFPNDVPQEVVEQQVKELDRVIANLSEAREALAGMVKAPAAAEVEDTEAQQKQKEFEADLAAKTRDAQAAAFAEEAVAAVSMPNVPAMPPEDIAIDWVCPDHQKPGIEKTAKNGTTFIGCPDCNKFKR